MRRPRRSLTRRPRAFVGGAFAVALVLALALVGASLVSARAGDGAKDAPAAGVDGSDALVRGIPQDGIALGAPDAPVTLVEYADLQCPFCAQWAREALPVLVRDYVRPGRVRMLFRGLAFLGPDSDAALRAALAAGEQGRLWNVVHLLYANQGPENGGWVTDELVLRIGAAVPGLDPDRMLAERRSRPVERELRVAAAAAERDGIRGTPAFAAGPTGGRLEPVPFSTLEAAALRARLDELLAG